MVNLREKRKLKRALILLRDEFIYGGHVLALGAISIVFTSSVLLKIRLTWEFLIVVYLGVYLVYLYDHYRGLDKDLLTNSERVQYLKRYIKYIPLIIFLCISIIIGIQLYLNKIEALLASLIMLSLGLFYSPYLKRLTRTIVGFKNFLAPLLWTSLVILLVIFYSITPSLSLFLILSFVCIRIFIGISFSDIKDIESDRKEGLQTFAIIFGKNKTLLFLSILNAIALLPIFFGFYLRLFPPSSLMLTFTSVYAFYYIKRSQDPKINLRTLTHKVVYCENLWWSILILIGEFLL